MLQILITRRHKCHVLAGGYLPVRSSVCPFQALHPPNSSALVKCWHDKDDSWWFSNKCMKHFRFDRSCCSVRVKSWRWRWRRLCLAKYWCSRIRTFIPFRFSPTLFPQPLPAVNMPASQPASQRSILARINLSLIRFVAFYGGRFQILELWKNLEVARRGPDQPWVIAYAWSSGSKEWCAAVGR